MLLLQYRTGGALTLHMRLVCVWRFVSGYVREMRRIRVFVYVCVYAGKIWFVSRANYSESVQG